MTGVLRLNKGIAVDLNQIQKQGIVGTFWSNSFDSVREKWCYELRERREVLSGRVSAHTSDKTYLKIQYRSAKNVMKSNASSKR